MSFQRVHRSKSQSPQSSSSTSQFAPHPFPVQEPKRLPTQEDIENEAFQQNKFEAFGLQLKEKSGTITPVEQERLGVLQAKMDSFWAQRMERAKAQPNLLEILIRNAQTAQTNESKVSAQPNAIQTKVDTTDNHSKSSVEQRPNTTELPDNLKEGVENLSGYSLDFVKVHYNSPKPSQLGALAYAQGTDIHVAPGQEEHLPHEAWHVVQQMQGRVKPTMQLKDGLSINDSDELEYEADLMGVKAVENPVKRQGALSATQSRAVSGSPHQVVQRFIPKPYMTIEIKNHKQNERLQEKGWDSANIDSLVDWCKTEKQYNSFIQNLTYEQWQELCQNFKGDELPVKVAGAWVIYQKKYMNVETFDNFTGYKGSGGTIWKKGENYADWSGCYIAESEEQAEGYIGEAGAESGKASLWKLTLKKPLAVRTFTGGFLDSDKIPGEYKARILKKLLKIDKAEKLIEHLGKGKVAYMGPAGEAGRELVIPWNMVDEYLTKQRVKEYTVNEDYTITNQRNLISS